MERLTSPERCIEVTKHYPQYFTFNVEEWFSDENNYALISGENIAFAEYKKPGIYWVHFCFHTAKGREAVELTKAIFDKFCSSCFVKTVVGLIEINNKKARWLIRQVGFKSLGNVETENGLCEMFYLTNGDNNGSF